MRWYTLAARAGVQESAALVEVLSKALVGDADSAASLGDLMNATGNAEQAEFWFRRAADLGHDNAVLALGNIIGADALMEWVGAAYQKGNPAAERLIRSLREAEPGGY